MNRGGVPEGGTLPYRERERMAPPQKGGLTQTVRRTFTERTGDSHTEREIPQKRKRDSPKAEGGLRKRRGFPSEKGCPAQTERRALPKRERERERERNRQREGEGEREGIQINNVSTQTERGTPPER